MCEGAVSAISGLTDAPALVSLTGGGGKTTLLFALARCFEADAQVISTTTTKIGIPGSSDTDMLMVGNGCVEDLYTMSSDVGHITVGRAIENEKVIGLAPEEVDKLYRSGWADYILVEADGAKRLPFKGYADYEPVVPSQTTHHFIVLGAEVLLSPLSANNTFRFDLLARRWGLREGEIVAIDTLSEILDSADEYVKNSPCGANRALIINKGDLFFCGSGGGEEKMAEIAHILALTLRSYDRLFVVSLARDFLYLHRELKRVG